MGIYSYKTVDLIRKEGEIFLSLNTHTQERPCDDSVLVQTSKRGLPRNQVNHTITLESLQDHEKINFCYLSHSVSDILLQELEQATTEWNHKFLLKFCYNQHYRKADEFFPNDICLPHVKAFVSIVMLNFNRCKFKMPSDFSNWVPWVKFTSIKHSSCMQTVLCTYSVLGR